MRVPINVKRCLALLSVIATLAACNTNSPTQAPPADSSRFGKATLLLPGHSEPREVVYEIKDGQAIFEGDIILGQVDGSGRLIDQRGLDPQSVLINEQGSRWPDGVIPYVIESSVLDMPDGGNPRDDGDGKANILLAMDHWEANTPIRFVQRTNQGGYVAFVKGSDSGACFSDIGRVGGRQEIKLTSSGNCSRGTLIHEIGHAVGLWHEQAREDRDRHVTILWDNIDTGSAWSPFDGYKSQFDRHINDGADSGAYDYDSIMHYGKDAFAKNGSACRGNGSTTPPIPPDHSKCTILPKNGVDPNRIGQSNGLSTGDIAAVRGMYAYETVATQSTDARCFHGEVCTTGDVNKDGKDDLVVFVKSGITTYQYPGGIAVPDPEACDVYVALASGNGFVARQKWHDHFCGGKTATVADINNDDRADLIAFSHTAAGEVWVALSTGSSFGPSTKWTQGFCMQSQEICTSGDFNGDGKGDVLTFHHGAWNGSSQVFVYLSNGSSFNYTGSPWTNKFCEQAKEVCLTGNFDGDPGGKDDIITFHHGAWNGSSNVFVYLSNGSSFYFPGKPWSTDFCGKEMKCAVGDVNGDGKDDIIAFEGSKYLASVAPPGYSSLDLNSGDIYVALSDGTRFGEPLLYHGSLCYEEMVCLVGNLNSDNKADLLWIAGKKPAEWWAESPKFGRVHAALSRP